MTNNIETITYTEQELHNRKSELKDGLLSMDFNINSIDFKSVDGNAPKKTITSFFEDYDNKVDELDMINTTLDNLAGLI